MKEAEMYIQVFQHATEWIDKGMLEKMQMEVAVGEVLDSVFLKMYKKTWVHPQKDPLTATSRIFFSVWINDRAIEEKIIFYNIHAFKLRELPGYAIASKKFAALFREKIKPYKQNWENLSVQYGPLTLMEGWAEIDPTHFQHVVGELANRFFEIAALVDETLEAFKK